MVKIELEKIDIQESIIVKALLDSSTMGLVMSLEFAKKKNKNLSEKNRKTNLCEKCKQFFQQGETY